MSKLLIVAATRAEINPLLEAYSINPPLTEGIVVLNKQQTVHVLITGVGMVNTAYCMGKTISGEYDFIINAGICGAFNRQLKIGQLLRINTDTLSEMGAENGDEFIPYPQLGLGGDNTYHEKVTAETPALKEIKTVSGITVNTVHGNTDSILKAQNLFKSDVESMEGAAFFRACSGINATCIQIRTISNYVEKRNRDNWNIPLAVKNLNEALIKIITDLTTA